MPEKDEEDEEEVEVLGAVGVAPAEADADAADVVEEGALVVTVVARDGGAYAERAKEDTRTVPSCEADTTTSPLTATLVIAAAWSS